MADLEEVLKLRRGLKGHKKRIRNRVYKLLKLRRGLKEWLFKNKQEA